MIQFHNPASSPAPVGPYSTAVTTGTGFLFLSGQIALDPSTGILIGATVGEQTAVIFKNIEAIITQCGYSVTAIIKVVVYVTDMGSFSELNTVYERFFGTHRPVRTTVGVASLPKGAMVELEITAFSQA